MAGYPFCGTTITYALDRNGLKMLEACKATTEST